jgi:hypothetical protein
VRAAHLHGDVYGVIWTADGELHHALFDSSQPPSDDLVLGEPLEFPSLESVTADRTSLTWWKGDAYAVWSDGPGERIETLRGVQGASGLGFGPNATFTPYPHDALSSVITHDGALFVAAKVGDEIRLLRTDTGGTGWGEVSSCDSMGDIRGGLLFADADGVVWVAESISYSSWLRSFADCETTDFPLPLTTGRLRYHPGS